MVMSVVTVSLGKRPSEMHCFQSEPAPTRLVNFTSDFIGSQLEIHLEIPAVMRHHTWHLLRYQTGLQWFAFYV